MANVALTERLLIGGLCYFIEEGTTVDSVTVAADAKPDNDPTSNWDELGCIETITFGKDEDTEEFLCPSASGGYKKETEIRVTEDYIDLQSSKYNELVHRLQYGLSAAVVQGTAQAPFEQTDRKINGWLKMQARKKDGTDLLIVDIWSEVRLMEVPNYENTTGRPTLRFMKRPSTLNSIVFPS